MMPASRKANLTFRYVRHEDDSYEGGVAAEDAEVKLEPFANSEAWVRFVIGAICDYPTHPTVVFELGERRHILDPRTVQKIRVQSLKAEDLVL